MIDCLVPFILAFLLFIVSLLFIIITINLHNKLQKKNLLRLYDIKDNESITKIINIRKNDGTSCNISIIHENGETKETKNPKAGPGSACK